MRILSILPGSGGAFYCQNCLRDMAVATALRQRGHQVTLLPLYLPATAQMPAPEDVPIFYGALTLYLRHRFAWLRKLPRAWFKPLDCWPLLRWVARLTGTTSAAGLEELTLSILRGPGGHQADELQLVVTWLNTLPPHEKPEIIVLSNALLAGLSATLKQAARCPIACWLQDEHVWLDAMQPDLRAAVLRVMVDEVRAIDCFLSVSTTYAQRMTALLALNPQHLQVVFPSLDPKLYPPTNVHRRPLTIGFLARLSLSEGFDRCIDAFILLHRDPRFCDVHLAATGGPSADSHFLKKQLLKISAAKLNAYVKISPTRFIQDRFGFLSELSLLSVPGSETPEAFGYYAIEAMAAGVPVVLPAQGAFPEITAAAECGILIPDTQPTTLATAWAQLLSNPDQLQTESEKGIQAAHEVFAQTLAAEKLEKIFASITKSANAQN